jgi:glutamyl-tRNA synthetase
LSLLGSATLNDSTSLTPRVRFAPSPTGSLHVGGARTALYNLLFARHTKGTFLLRIEDTDVERSREELTGQILSAMEWLGLDYDEGPFYQSKRYDLYREAADRLIREGKAYRAFETPEELDVERKAAEAAGRAYRYSGAARAIPPEESERRARAGERHVVRLKMPAETLVVDDLIRGRVEFPAEALDDFVLVRSDGHPLYHFCVCVDDADMRITHVIRGDDHLANTPKHVALFRALGASLPTFAHLGMILGTDRKKLSKRHGAAAVEEWRDAGILPETLFNFLALLGWAPGGDREILSRAEMEAEFSLERVGASPSVFDPEKLLWMNQQYIAKMPAAELLARSLPYAAAGAPPEAVALKAIELHRARVRTPIEMGRALATYATPPASYDADGLKKHVKPETGRQLGALAARLEALPDWTAASTEAALRATAEAEGASAGKLIHPVRLALTGVTVGAPLFDVVELLGRDESLRRLRGFLEAIRAETSPA